MYTCVVRRKDIVPLGTLSGIYNDLVFLFGLLTKVWIPTAFCKTNIAPLASRRARSPKVTN